MKRFLLSCLLVLGGCGQLNLFEPDELSLHIFVGVGDSEGDTSISGAYSGGFDKKFNSSSRVSGEHEFYMVGATLTYYFNRKSQGPRHFAREKAKEPATRAATIPGEPDKESLLASNIR